MIIDLTGSESRIVYRELLQDDPLQRRPDITLARQELGWDPVIPLEKGLLKTIDYFRGVL